MEGQVLNDARQRFTTDIRIDGGNKKSSYRTARVKGFPVTETCSEFREAVKNIIHGEPFTENFSFGFIDKKQKKLWVLTDTELPDAYAAAITGQPLWVDPSHVVVNEERAGSVNKKGNQTNKRKYKLLKRTRVFKSVTFSKINSLFLIGSHDDANAASPSFTEKIDEQTKTLEDKHGETVFQPYQYRRWAEMLV